jgi:hypothetical protein
MTPLGATRPSSGRAEVEGCRTCAGRPSTCVDVELGRSLSSRRRARRRGASSGSTVTTGYMREDPPAFTRCLHGIMHRQATALEGCQSLRPDWPAGLHSGDFGGPCGQFDSAVKSCAQVARGIPKHLIHPMTRAGIRSQLGSRTPLRLGPSRPVLIELGDQRPS